jgi:hypothetical protein
LLFDNEDVAAIRTHRWKYVDLTYYRGHAVSCSDLGVPSYFRTREVAG